MCGIKTPLSCIYDIKKYKLLITVKVLYYLMSIANYLEINLITFIYVTGRASGGSTKHNSTKSSSSSIYSRSHHMQNDTTCIT